MDIKLEKKPWYIRYRYYLIGGILFVAFLIYVITLSLGPRKLRIDAEDIQIAEVKVSNFMEYVDVEGLIQPILTIKINTREAGSVERIVGEEGSLLQQGDTILVLSNPDLLRSIEDQRDEWEKQMITYQEQEIEMEQKSLNLKQQALTNSYELERLKKSIALDREEFQMGVKSKAQLQVAEDEYCYKQKNAALQQESLRHDSAVTMIRKELIRNDRERERKKYERTRERLNSLVVTAPLKGQLSFVKVTPGQQVSSGESIAVQIPEKETEEMEAENAQVKQSPEEMRQKELKEVIEQYNREKQDPDYYYLPDSWDGQTLKWQKPGESTGTLLAALALFAAVVLMLKKAREQQEEIAKRAEQLLMDYPSLIMKFTLLIQAGMTVRRAFQKISSDYLRNCPKEGRYAYEAVTTTCHEMDSGVAELEAYRRFGERCGQMKYKTFSTILIQNLQKGGHRMADLLEKEALEAGRECLSIRPAGRWNPCADKVFPQGGISASQYHY